MHHNLGVEVHGDDWSKQELEGQQIKKRELIPVLSIQIRQPCSGFLEPVI